MPARVGTGIQKQSFLVGLGHKCPLLIRRSRVTAVAVHSRHRGFGQESLEHAIAAINKIIFEQEQKRQRQRASRADASKGRVEVDVHPVSKPITFKASAKTEKLVKEPAGASAGHPARGLGAYLSLPLDQYSLLDPDWISRSPAAPDVFVLRIPLFDLVGLELQPQITVRVSLDPRNSQVHFLADQFKVGDPRFDEDFKLNMRATLRNKPVPTLRPLRSIKRMWSRAGRGYGAAPAPSDPAAGGAGTVDAAASTAAAAGPADSAQAAASGSPGPTRHFAGAGVAAVEAEPLTSEEGRPAGQHGSGRAAGWGAGGESSSYERLDPAAVLDVGIQQAGGESAGGSGAGGGSGGGGWQAPDLPPHVTVVAREWTAGTAERGPPGAAVAAAGSSRNAAGEEIGDAGKPAGWAPGDGASAEQLAVTPRASTGGTASISASTSPRGGSAPGGPDDGGARHGLAASLAGAPGSSSSGSGADVSTRTSNPPPDGREAAQPSSSPLSTCSTTGVQAWPPGAYGPGHPAAAAATSAAGQLWGTAPAAAPAAVTAPAAASRAQAPAGTPLGLAAVGIAVPRAAEARPPTAAAPPAASDETLPFIEDEVLYVPASQWGREPGAPAGASPVATSASAASGSAGGSPQVTRVAVARVPAPHVLAGPTGGAGNATTERAMAAGPSQIAATAAPAPGVLRSDAQRVSVASAAGSLAGSGGRSDPHTDRVIDTTAVSTASAPSAAAPPPPGESRGVTSHAATVTTLPGQHGPGSGAVTGPGSAPNVSPGSGSEAGPGLGSHNTRTTATAASGDATVATHGSTATAVTSPHPHLLTSSPHPSTSSADSFSNSVVRSGGGGVPEPAHASPGAAGVAATAAGGSPPQGGSAAIVAMSESASARQAGPGAAADDPPTSVLVGNVDVAVTVMLPPALTAVPRPLLGMTGSLIARYAISSLLPSFLDLLIADYGRWSTGQTVTARAAPVGDLAATAAANAAAMGAAPGRSNNAAHQMASAIAASPQPPTGGSVTDAGGQD